MMWWGANVNAISKNGSTALHYASTASIVDLLLTNGADINCVNERGNTPLHTAVERGPEQVVSALIKKGANVNLGNDNQFTPLHLAIINKRRVTVVEELLDAGADMFAISGDNQTALTKALNRGDPLVFSTMLNRLLGSYKNKTAAEILKSFGEPRSKKPDGKGGDLWAYERIITKRKEGYVNFNVFAHSHGGFGGIGFDKPQTGESRICWAFLIDNHGICTDVEGFSTLAF